MERRPSAAQFGKDEQWSKNGYDIILTRNMFSRNRRPVRVGPEPPRVVPNPESYFLLKGVVQEDNQFIAFVEDKNSGAVLRLRQGDRVARGQVKSLTLDVLEYQLQDKTIAVNMGYDLEGGRGTVTAADLASLTPTVAPATPTTSGSPAAPAAVPAANADEVIKRLMEQRQQQLGR